MKQLLPTLTFILLAFIGLRAQQINPDFQVAVTRPATITTVAEQPDGKILIGGILSKVNGQSQFSVARLLANGQTDNTFTPEIRDTAITCIALQPDQKILVGGYTEENNQEVGILFRLQADGSVDQSFQVDTFNTRVQSIRYLSNQRIAVGGIFREYGSTASDGLILLNTNGSLAQTFDLAPDNSNLFIYDILQSGNQFYAGGNIGSNARLFRFSLDGQLDNSFSIDTGVGDSDFMTAIQQLALTSGGNLVFTTYTWEFNPQVITVTPTGIRIFEQSIPNPLGLTLTNQDHILVSGEFEGRPNVYRVSNSGLSAFGGGQYADDQVYNLLTLGNGNILVTGRFGEFHAQSREAIALLNNQGSLQANFNPSIQRSGLIQQMIRFGDKLYIGGDFTRVNGQEAIHLARLNLDGSLDQSFQQSSIPMSKPINGFHILNNGKIMVGTSASSLDSEVHIPIRRLNTNGSQDVSFQIPNDISILGNVNGFVELDNNQVVAYGSYSMVTPQGFYRLIGTFNTNGSLDASLSSVFNGSSLNDVALVNGNLLLGGNNLRVNNGTSRPAIMVSPSGTLLGSFSIGLDTRTQIRSIFPQADGSFLLSGDLHNGSNYQELIQIRANGSIDPRFVWPTTTDSPDVTAVARGIDNFSNGDLLITSSAAEPEGQMLITSSTGEVQNKVFISQNARLNFAQLENDSTFYVGGAFTITEDQISLVKIDLGATTTPVDTSDNNNEDGLSLSISSDSVEVGESVCVQLTAQQLENLLGAQLTINYDATLLDFESLANFGLNGLNENDFGLPGDGNNQPGEIRLAWIEPNLSGQTLEDGATLFEICFSGKAVGTADVEIVGYELVDASDNILDPEINNGSIVVTEEVIIDPDPIPDTLTVSLGGGSVKQGEDICIPVRVKDFNDVMGMQFNINFDETKLEYKSLQNFNLNSLDIGSFGVPGMGNVPDGQIKLAWFDLDVNGITLADETIIFEICFTALADAGSTDLSFSNVEITGEMNEPIEFIGETNTINFFPQDETPLPLEITIGDGSVKAGESLCVPVSVNNFEELLGLTVTINYDPTKLQYEAVGNFNLPSLTLNRFDEPGIDGNPIGQIKLTWFDFNNGSVSVPNGTNIFEICFTATQSLGSSELSLSDATIFDKDNQPVEFIGNSGTVTVTPGETNNDDFTISISSDSVLMGEQVCVQLTTQNFTDVVGIELTVDYDPSLLQYESVGNFNLTGLSSSIGEPGQGLNPPGKLKVAWFDQQVEGVTLPDGTVLFEICFTALAEMGTATIDFSEVEITDPELNDIPFTGEAGQIVIGEEEDDNNNNNNGNEDITLSIVGNTITEGEAICIPILVQDFENIKTLGFEVSFDPNLLSFQGVQNYAIPSMSSSITEPGTNNLPVGRIRLNWADGNGQTLTDGSVLFELCFFAINNGISGISLSNGSATDINDRDLSFIANNAFLTVEEQDDGKTNFFTIQVSSDTVEVGEIVCLEVSVENFANILGVKLDINYDPNLLEFESVGNFNLDNLDLRSFELPGMITQPGTVRLSWLDQDLSGVTLPDGTVIFEICFLALAPNSIGSITLSDPTILDADGNVLTFIGIAGTIMIESSLSTSTEQIQAAQEQFDLYPVPARTEMTLDWKGKDFPAGAQLRIMNLSGQQVQQALLQSEQQRLMVHDLAPGIYYLIVQTPDSILYRQFVKQ